MVNKEKPIIFSTPEVRSTLDGRKTQKRLVVKLPSDIYCENDSYRLRYFDTHFNQDVNIYPRYQPGDILWVRETWQNKGCNECPAPDWPCATNDNCIFGDREYLYAADNFYEQPLAHTNYVTLYEDIKWRPSIHMPRIAARIFLRVTDVRVERLQEISEDDSRAEGYPFSYKTGNVIGDFMHLWNSLNNKRGFGWEVNPWVWVILFERIDNK